MRDGELHWKAPRPVATWPAFTGQDPLIMHLDAAPAARPVPNLPQLEALDAYYAWRRERSSSP